jgi:hypothetical protein
MNVPDPPPVIDGLLAATARVLDLTLVTRQAGALAGPGLGPQHHQRLGPGDLAAAADQVDHAG